MAKTVKKVVIEGSSIGLDKVVGELAKISSRLDKITSQQVNIDTSAAQTSARNLSKATDSMASSAEKGQARASKALERLGAINRATGRDMSDLTRTSASALTIAYAEIAANVYAAAAAFNAVKAGAQFDNLLRSQEQLAATTGTNFGFISSKLKEATGNALDFQRAAQYANLGRAAGLSTQQISKLAEAGTKASIALGRDLGDSIDRIFRGTIKGEPEILDELGIIIRLGDATEKYAEKLGVKADALTSAQKSQAIYNAVLAESAKFEGVSADPDAFTRLAGAIRDTALEIGAMVSKVFGPFAAFLADNRGALLAFATTIGASVLGKAIGAFGSDVAGATERLAAMEVNAKRAQVALQALRVKQAASSGIAADIGSTDIKAREFRDVARLTLQGLGDLSGGSKQLQNLSSALDNTAVKARDIPSLFTGIGQGATSMASQVIGALKRSETTGKATFMGIKDVAKSTLVDVASVTQAALLREAEERRKYATQAGVSAKNQASAAQEASKLTAQANAISNQLMLSNTRTTFLAMGASATAFSATVQVAFARVGVAAATLGATVSAALGWIGVIFGAIMLLKELASGIGATTNGLADLEGVASATEGTLTTLSNQVKLLNKNVDSFAGALANMEATASALDTVSTLTNDMVSALDKVEPGLLANLFDIGSSDIEENLQGYVDYLSKIGELDTLNKALSSQGLELGNIDDTTEDVTALKAALETVKSELSASAEEALFIKAAFDGVKESTSKIATSSEAYAKSLYAIDSNLVNLYNAQKDNLLFIEGSQKRVAGFSREYSSSIDDINAKVEEQLSIWDNIGDAIILAFRNMGEVTGLTARERLQQEEQGKADNQQLQKLKAEATGLISVFAAANGASDAVEDLRNQLNNVGEGKEGIANTIALIGTLRGTAEAQQSKELAFTTKLALSQSNAALASKEYAAQLAITSSALGALGLSTTKAEELQQQQLSTMRELQQAEDKYQVLMSRDNVPEYEKRAARNTLAGIRAELNAVGVAMVNLNPVQEVFGNSLKTLSERLSDFDTRALKLTDKGKEIIRLQGELAKLEANGTRVDVASIESDALKAANRDAEAFALLANNMSKLDVITANLTTQNKALGIEAGSTRQQILAISEAYSNAARNARALAIATGDLNSDKAISAEIASTALATQKLEISQEVLNSVGLQLGAGVASVVADRFGALFEEVYSSIVTPRLAAINADQTISEEVKRQQIKQAEEESRILAKQKVLQLANNGALTDAITAQEALTRAIERQKALYGILDGALEGLIDSLFGIGNKSGGELLKDSGKALIDNLFGGFKDTLKQDLKSLDLAGTIGKIIPEGLQESFGKVSAFFGKGGAGATFAKSAGAIFQGIAAGAEKNGFQGALIQGAFTAIGAIFGPIGAAIGSVVGGMLTGTAKKVIDSGLMFNISGGEFSGSKFTTTSREKSFLRGTETKTRTSMLAEKESEEFLRSFESVNQAFTSALNKYASYFQQEVRAVDALGGVVFGEKLSLKGLKVEEQQKKIQSFFSGYGDALVDYAVPGLKQMQKQGETLIDTLNRVTRVTMMADTAFKSIFNLDANGAKSLLGSRSPSARKDLTQMVLREVKKDLEFAYSFVSAKDLDVDVKMPKEKNGLGAIVAVVIAAVLTVVTAGAGAALLGAVASGLSAVGATAAAGVVTAAATGVAAGGLAGLAATAATGGLIASGVVGVTAAVLGAAVMSAASSALADAAVNGLIDADIGKNLIFNQDDVKFAAQDGFGGNLKSIQNLMRKYRKATFTLTADKFALDLETGIFEETEKRIRLFRSKGGNGNAKKLKAEYEKQLNLLNEYSTVLAYLTLQAAGIDLEGTNLEAKALGQIRAKFYDEVMGFFDGADAKEKEEAFTKALQNYAQGTSSTLELVANGIDGALNSIKASVYTITGAYAQDAKDLIASLDYVKTVGDAIDVQGRTKTGRSRRSVKTNKSIITDLFKSFTESLGLSGDNQLAAYQFLTELTANEIAATGNLTAFMDTKRLSTLLKGKGINVSAEVVKALQAALPALQTQFTEVTESLEIMNSITTRLNEGLPETQLPSLIRFTKIFDDVMALAPNPEVVAEMIKIGDTLTQAIAALSEAFKGFSADALIGYLEKARDSATSFSELGTFVASEFVAGTRAGLKETFKNAIVEDFQKQLVGPILAGVANAVSGAFAGNTTNIVFQLTPEEIAATEARLLNTASILADMLSNPTLNSALGTLGTTLGNITSQFLDLTGSAEEIAEVAKDFSQSLAGITANIELEAFSASVGGDNLLVSRFKAMQAFRSLDIDGFGTEMLTKSLSEVIASANLLIQAGTITKDNIGDVTSAIQALADVSAAAREKLSETAQAIESSLNSITDKIGSLTLDIIKAGTGNKMQDLANAGTALDAYLASVYLSVDKARTEYEKAKLDGNLILAAEKAGELESALTNYSQAQIDAIRFTSELSQDIYDEQTKSLEGLKDLAQSLKDFIEDIKFDDRLSILKPIDRLAAAEEDFASMRQRILSGELDITKLTSEEAQKVIEDSRRLLDLGRDVYASGNEYTELYNQVMQTIGAAQAQVDSAVTLTDADIARYQTDSLAVQAQIRNIQLSTLSELQLIAAQLGVNGALVQAMSESGTFNVALDPTTVRQYAYDNTEVLTLLASAISNTTSATDTGYMPLMDTYLSAVLAASNPLSIQNLLGTAGGDMLSGSLDTLLSAYGTFTSPLAGFNFGGLDYFTSDLGQSAPTDVALLPVSAPTYDTSALIEQLLAAPINYNLLSLGGSTGTTDTGGTDDTTLTRDELLDVRLIEVLDKLELVLAALPLSLRTAILQQNIATQRV